MTRTSPPSPSAPQPTLPPSGETVDSLRARLGIAYSAFAEELARLGRMTPGTHDYEQLVRDILRRAPAREQIEAVERLARLLGPSRARARIEDLLRLAFLPLGSAEYETLRARLVREKIHHDLAVDVVEHDEERAEDMRRWRLQLLESYGS